MTDKEFENIMTGGIEMYESLLHSIDKAGGTGASFVPFSKLQEMTVSELFGHLATNNIRFTFKRPKKRIRKDDK